ncbi:hypothetical protein GCK72_014877 [Caenorhabditis remanei]|uniref:RING-type domain-containing protein n=1 Tax=Caenorhabditis remanei TaxID=31234 RepID=A0A6A5GV55_CAERE|nr:hypothetical protein GCK72_014877 [Caenorhabditis remanei]KAF1758419.1 hypothetical protein GCK72_014877 [Caenorhabditis remanei]
MELSVSEDDELIDLAKFELIRLEGIVRIYEETLSMNILILQKTRDVSQLLPMHHPCLSPEFMKKYSDLMIGLTTEVPDTDCLICHEYRESHEKTIECETTCHKVYHLKCASEWFKQQQTCPHCRSRMLDDEEYPAL